MAVEKQVYGTNNICSSAYTGYGCCMRCNVSKANRFGFTELLLCLVHCVVMQIQMVRLNYSDSLSELKII